MGFLGFRLVILAGMGLAALYMLHVLAQDYNKIRKPVAKLATLFLTKSKRDTGSVLTEDAKVNFTINWTRILQSDPLLCAQSLICQLSSGAEKGNSEAFNILILIQYSLNHDPPNEIKKAYEMGLIYTKKPQQCYNHYPFCPYSAKTMLKIIQIHSVVFS